MKLFAFFVKTYNFESYGDYDHYPQELVLVTERAMLVYIHTYTIFI